MRSIILAAAFLPVLPFPAACGEKPDARFELACRRRFVFDAERPVPEGISFLPAAHYSGTVRALPAEMRFVRDGKTLAAFAAPTNTVPPYEMHLVLTGAHRPAVFVTKDGRTSLAYEPVDLGGFDPRVAAFTNTVSFAATGGLVCPRMTLSAGVGQADTRFVTYGRSNVPYEEDGRLFFTFSARAYGSSLGVMSLDPDKGDFRLEGVILFDYGDGLLRNDVAADLFFDDVAGEWRAYVSNFSTGSDSLGRRARGGVNVAWTKTCPLRGVSVMKAKSLGLEGMNEDPDGFWDEAAGKWRLLVSEFTERGIRASLLESDRWDGGFVRIAGPVLEDSTGTTLARLDGKLRALAGSADRAFHVYDYPSLARIGKIAVDAAPWDVSGSPNGRSWPAYAELPDGRCILLTFDRVNFSGMPTPNWTYGSLFLYRACARPRIGL